MDEFLKTLLGCYHNKKQAFANPSRFAYIHSLWEMISDTEFYSKQWYNYAGKDSPYRENYHTLEENNNYIIVHQYDINKNPRNCDIVFHKNGSNWEGQNCGVCIVKDAELETKMILTGLQMMCYDAGIKNGQIAWGGRDLYIFDKVTERL
jgi:hypothetical protein